MSVSNDLQPKSNTIKVHDKKYIMKPMKMSHRLIIIKLEPLFSAFESVSKGESIGLSAKQLLDLEEELDLLITSLIPNLKDVTLDINDIADVLSQIMDTVLPEDAKELNDANIEVNKDPKVTAPEKN